MQTTEGQLTENSVKDFKVPFVFWVGMILAVWPYFVLLKSQSSIFAPSLYGDYDTLQLPLREYIYSELWAGRMPLWIPELGCGMPIHASLQASVLHPILTPMVLVAGPNMGIKLTLFLHIIIAYVGQYHLCRKLGISAVGSLLAGIVVAQSGFCTSHIMAGHVTVVIPYCWLPCLGLTILNLFHETNLWNA